MTKNIQLKMYFFPLYDFHNSTVQNTKECIKNTKSNTNNGRNLVTQAKQLISFHLSKAIILKSAGN